MQVWREGINQYNLHFGTNDDSALNITVEDTAMNDRVLAQYTLSQGVVMQNGDVFGVRIPGYTNVARFHPLFLDLGAGNAPAYFYLEGQAIEWSFLFTSLMKKEKYLSLVAVEYGL